jgi:hypothetical protein
MTKYIVQPSDLRIGNVILVDGLPSKVTVTKQNLVVCTTKPFRTGTIVPIKINEPILEKIGFEDVGGVDVFCKNYKWHEYDLEKSGGDDNYIFVYNRNILTKIKFLHQLQNAWHSLTHEELDVTAMLTDLIFFRNLKKNECSKSPNGEHEYISAPDSFDLPYCKYCYSN